MLVMAQM